MKLIFIALLISGMTIPAFAAPRTSCYNNDCTDEPVTVGGQGTIPENYARAAAAYATGTIPTQQNLTGVWNGAFSAPIDDNWNTSNRLATTTIKGFRLSFDVTTTGGDDFLNIKGQKVFSVKVGDIYAYRQGPNRVTLQNSGACFATYAYNTSVLTKDTYFAHSCRLLTAGKLICALTFKTEATDDEADKPYNGKLIGYIGYVKGE